MSARDDYPWDLGVSLGVYRTQWESMCDQIDRLREINAAVATHADRSDAALQAVINDFTAMCSELEEFAREAIEPSNPFAFGWIVGWLDRIDQLNSGSYT